MKMYIMAVKIVRKTGLESLVELADRKNIMGTIKISERPSGWRIVFSNGNVFIAATYAECEAKAREHLNNLRDKE